MSLELLKNSIVNKDFIHDLIQKEFRSLLTNSNYEIPKDTKAIVILSAPPNLEKNGEEIEKTPENIQRISLGIEIFKEVVAKKLNKDVKEINESDLQGDQTPILVLNGEEEQLSMMEEVARSFNFPKNKIKLINCGVRGVGNSKTQFEKINDDEMIRKYDQITVVTSSYHVPRVARTANTILPAGQIFEVIGVPYEKYPFNVYSKVKGEVEKIILYSKKGHISKNLPSK